MEPSHAYKPSRWNDANCFRPDACDLFFDVPVTDLSGVQPFPEPPSDLVFSILVCREGEIRAAAEPCRPAEDGTREFLDRDGCAAVEELLGSPVIPACPGESGQALASRIRQALREAGGRPSRWKYVCRVLSPRERDGLLARRLLTCAPRPFRDESASPLDHRKPVQPAPVYGPTAYGRLRGLREGYLFSKAEDDSPGLAGDGEFARVVCCTPESWTQICRPWEPGPLWEQVPMETRLALLIRGRCCNIGYGAAIVRKIAEAPLSAYTAHYRRLCEQRDKPCVEIDILRDGLGDLSITYGQAAVKIDRLLQEPHTRSAGLDLMEALAAILGLEYQLRRKKR